MDDLIELVEWVRRHLEVENVAILGHSWGSALATTAVAERPDLFSVYVGVGQVVYFEGAEQDGWQWARDEAIRRADTRAVTELEALAPYPGARETASPLLPRLATERSWVTRFGGLAAYRDSCAYFSYGELTTGWTEVELQASIAGAALQGDVLVPQMREIDLRSVNRLEVPMVQMLGRHDQMTPTGPVLPWLDDLDAPSIVALWFDRSAHLAMYEEPGRFLVAMHEHVLPHASRSGRPPDADS